MNLLFWLIVLLVLADFAWSNYLTRLNQRSWSAEIPEGFKDLYDAEKYERARQYDREKTRLGQVSGTFSLVVILGFLFAGGFAWLNAWTASLAPGPVWHTLLFFGALFLAGDALSTPFSIYAIFHIEDKYGFNRMTWKTYWTDKVKSLLLTAVLGGGVLGLVTWFYYSAGEAFWWYAWVAVTTVSVFFAMFYTSLIVPLFNKLKPLEAGELKTRIEEFAARVSFPLRNIFVIDGSKRSSKANAYFSGLGSKKSIVLYDTLVEDHTNEELVAILAHEVGHYKHKHIRLGMLVSVLHTGLLFFLIGAFAGSPQLAQALGVAEPNFHIGLLAFGLLYSPISMITGLLMNALSRRNEYQADHYAKTEYAAQPLIDALKKLSVKHLSNLTPHPLYVKFYYTHPPLLERIGRLEGRDAPAAQ